jgi:DNA-binding response OmpR family regulator
MAKRLLLVENYEDNICQMLAGVFQRSGFETELPTTLAGCLEAVRRRSPDAVLMITNNLHNPSAFEIAEAIRSLQPTCGFVFLAGSEQDGRDGFLTAGYRFSVHWTPIPIPELRSLVSEANDHPAEAFFIPTRKR